MKQSDTNAIENQFDAPAHGDGVQKSSHARDSVELDETQTAPDSDAASTKTARRRFLQLLGTGTVLSLAGCSSLTGKASKGQVNYQDHPKGDQRCSNCRFYEPPENGDSAGTCSRVEGEIAPDAWCNVYSKG
ncbi:high-potential iron-sulfur protein [Haladaptatus halobius]|uniref:high-potential iron-sulfur protein n=1 Tax=Haladaptatus halobius TaxID=2884875 RepID=UPI001D0BAA9E|nr:high-potential iron-sulfur protein [Haladaptatus halobius]